MLAVRAAGPSDIDALMELARLSGRGFTSLPEDKATLADRLDLSAASFSGEVAPAEAWYTLLLEDSGTGRIDGVAAVRAAVGLKRPHFSFRVMTLAQYSPAIGTRFDHQALVLVNECGGWSEVGSLFVRAERRAGGAGSLLAASRYMLIGADPLRFSETVMAELRGWFGRDGASCPFWDGVASKFFRLPFDQADAMVTSTDGQFILDLAPRHPIYLELIAPEARDAVGRVHRDGQAALAMLEREGFALSGLVDIFDGGPTVTCRRDQIASLRNARAFAVSVADRVDGAVRLLSTGSVGAFRAVRAAVNLNEDGAMIDAEAARALKVEDGMIVRVRL
ncbi:MAG: arginine N-succinyltransferase [Sphingomonas sanxanigenens]|uniref:Arginine N-succinyltransferase n=1 Tax=Sphingomonas sanxanigenens TaxID=397260 RepID=A0A2W5AGR5_9SPHN|nr:MAG: arginine N-succinyltransferase [Sphingomonas sanxanigenens]